jgi:predicted N-acyltransferase
MKVVLDVNKSSSVSCGVQVCSSVEGFIEVMKMHPNDEFVIDEASADAYVDYMRTVASLDWDEFCDGMHITKQDYDAMVNFYQNTEPMPDPVHDKELFVDELLAEDYYAELQEAYDETIYSLKYSFN